MCRLIFWIYWVASASTSKESVPSGWRTRLTGVSAVGVFLIAGVLRGGGLAMHSVILAAVGALLFACGIALAIWARLPGRPEGAIGESTRADQRDAALSSRELITWLADRRSELGLSQAEVAQRMQTSQPAVARLESQRYDAQLSTLARYVEALGLSLDFLLREKPTSDT